MNRRAMALWEVFLLALIAFLGWHLTGLTDIDEGFYGAIASEMRWRGDWIVPHLNGLPWFEKPVLVYWGAATSMSVFGPDFGARLFSILCSIGTVAISFQFLRRLISPQAAEYSVWILCTSILFVLVGRLLLADAPFVFFLTLGMSLWIRAALGETKLAWAAGVAVGFGLLSKGPIALVIVAIVALWTQKSDPDLRASVQKSWLPLFVGAIGACAVWYIPAFAREPQLFWSDFIIKQNIARLAGGDEAHRAPIQLYVPYYFLVLLVAFAPWWWWAVKGWPKRSTVPDRTEQIRRIVGRWAAVILIIFTISGSKLPHYILPAVIPLAWITAMRLGVKPPRRWAVYAHTVALSALAITALLTYYRTSHQQEAHQLAHEAVRLDLPIANYQIRARKRDLSMSAAPRETSLPSLNVVYGKVPLELETLEPIFAEGKPTALFTRKSRISFADQVQAAERGWQLKQVETKTPQTRFELYVLAPKKN